MHIGYVSTFPPMRCAIGVYTQKLARALTQLDGAPRVTVLAEQGAAAGEDHPGVSVLPLYRRDEDYVDAIERGAVEAGCELVHFQHAGDLLGVDERLPRLLARLKSRGIRTVVTLHTVYDETPGELFHGGGKHAAFYRELSRELSQFVVHHDEGCATKLQSQGIAREQLTVIPHGTSRMALPDARESRRVLGLPEEGFYFTFFGFIHLQKNVHRVVQAFARIAGDFPQAHLLVSGMPWGDRWYNHLYTGLMKARVAVGRLGAQIHLRDSYLPAEHVPHVYGASDAMLLPHNQSYGSASGVFHQAIGAGKPVLCAIGPKFVDAQRALADVPELCVPPTDIGAWAAAMRRVLEQPELLARGQRAVEAYATATEWPTVADAHARLYARLLAP